MQIYYYDPNTGAYRGPGVADIDPLGSKNAGETRYMIPAGATTIAPPTTGKYKAAIFRDNTWRIVPDFSGQTVCQLGEQGHFVEVVTLKIGDEMGQRQILSAPPGDDIPSPRRSGTKWVDGRSTDEILAALAALRWNVETSGTTWNGWPVSTDNRAQAKLVSEAMGIQAGLRQDGDAWKFADGVFRPLSNSEFMAMSGAVRSHIQKCFKVENIVAAQVEPGIDPKAAWAIAWAAL